ncbi:MAG TPA: glycosyltransferase [Kiritimatiellia bacterium]|nr:glycosyltransferase [Kiritimatiellia bacterium]HRZ12351.1 glycosyltransferase [Kiritimatiellia bacterium]HSA17891.1 glycosyltransferase [Kiritimatiellia bacterium]
MKICYLNNHLYLRSGAERVMFTEAALMRQAGHEVSFFGCRGPDDLAREHAAFYPPRVVIERLQGLGKWRHAFRVVYNPAVGRAFRRFLDAVRPEILHAHNIYGGLTTAVLDAARDAGLPVVLTAHDYKLVCPSYLALDHGRVCTACKGGRFYRCLLKRCHKSSLAASALYTAEAYLAAWGRKYAVVRRFICPSRFLRQTFLDNGRAPERVAYVPNHVATDSIRPSFGEGSYALFVGRLSLEKGLTTLLRATEGLGIPLRIVGEGPLRGGLEDQAVRNGRRGQVVFAGYRAGGDLAREYRDAAFLVIPSEWYENAPMVVLEAFAHGKPVIGAAMGGIPELVEPGKTGLLFPPGDVEALRQALASLWQNRASWGALGAAARRRAEEEFTPDRHRKQLLAIYEDCLRCG